MKIDKPFIIGMIHLPALVGYPEHPGMEAVIEFALKELEALEKGGVDGVLIENASDQPHVLEVGPEIVAAMTVVTRKVVEKTKLKVGVQVLINDPKASLAIASLAGADFIRTDYFVDKMSREKYGGEIAIDPKGWVSYREAIGASGVAILADLQVKYATLLEEGKSLGESAKQAVEAGADGLVVTGSVTGEKPITSDVFEAKSASGKVPVLVGSGFGTENATELMQFADGAIVGTSLKGEDGMVSVQKVAAMMAKVGGAK